MAINRSVVVRVQQAHSSQCFTISPDLPYPAADTRYNDGSGTGGGGGGVQERAVPSYNRVWDGALGVLFRDPQNRTVYGIVFAKRDLRHTLLNFQNVQ